jgi:hypothetical protein
MARIWADRVKETTATTGTGTINLDGAVTGFRDFDSVMATADTCYYAIVGSTTEWEVGLGTFTAGAPDTLARTLVLASSNAGAAVNFSAGTKEVFLTAPGNLFASTVASVNVQVIAASGTYTPTAGMIYCIVEVQAAGGGSGASDSGASSFAKATGGGGAGEYRRGVYSAATIGASQTVTIGAAGTAGTGAGGNGGNAANTTFGALITAVGGTGSVGTGSNATSILPRLGGAGGSGGSGGSFAVAGGAGTVGFTCVHSVGSPDFIGIAGIGGASFMGKPGLQNFSASTGGTGGSDFAGVAGQDYGAGANGALDNDNTESNGAAGGPAVVIITEYIAF